MPLQALAADQRYGARGDQGDIEFLRANVYMATAQRARLLRCSRS